MKIGSSIVEPTIINSSEIQTAEKKLQEAFDGINDVHNIIQKWVGYKEKARLLYMCCLAVYILELSQPVIKFLQKSILPLIGLPPNIVEVAERVNMNVAQAGAQGVAQGAKHAGAQGARQLVHKKQDRLEHKEQDRLEHKGQDKLEHKEPDSLVHKEQGRLVHKERERLEHREQDKLAHREPDLLED